MMDDFYKKAFTECRKQNDVYVERILELEKEVKRLQELVDEKEE